LISYETEEGTRAHRVFQIPRSEQDLQKAHPARNADEASSAE